MKNRDFRISFKAVWGLVIGNILLTVLGVVAKIQHWDYSLVVLTIGLMLFLMAWIILFSDMVKNKIYNRTFWIMSMFIMPSLALLLYMFRRNRLIEYGQKFV